MEAQALLDGVSRNIPRAEEARRSNQADTCLLHSHMAAEYACKLASLRQGGKVGYATFRAVIEDLLQSQTLTRQTHAELDWLRRLRNKVYHEAYLPNLEEAGRALEAARMAADLVMPRSP